MSTVHQAGRNNYSDSVSDATSTGEAANIHTKLKSISCELSNMRSWLSQGGEAETVKPSPSTPSIHTSHLPSCSGGQYKVHLPPTYFQSNFTRTQLLSHLSLAPCAGSCREMEVVKLTSDLFKYAPSHFFMTHHTSQPQFCDNLSTQLNVTGGGKPLDLMLQYIPDCHPKAAILESIREILIQNYCQV